MTSWIEIGGRAVGDGEPAYLIGEIGINHNGDIEIAKRLIDVAAEAGCDAVKFQKRTPEICVPPEQRDRLRETPWGVMTYMEYRYRVEFGEEEYRAIDEHAKIRGLQWFASPWDEPSVDFLERFEPVAYKVASACLTDDGLLRKLKETGRPVILSTGMSTLGEIRHAVALLARERLLVAHSTSSYPAKAEELNLAMIRTLREVFDVPIGYSGHETGLQTSLAARVLGACFIERHVTLDRAMWGSDHAASLEPQGLERLVRDIRLTDMALGDGVKQVYDSELAVKAKLRRVG
jgi:sialic acid synthase SpsE